MMVPIQIQPDSHLHRLRIRYHKNRKEHIQALEQAVIDLERERDAALYQLERQQRVLIRMRLLLETLS